MKFSWIALLIATVHVLVPAPDESASELAAEARDRDVAATSRWLDALSESNRGRAGFAFDAPERFDWHFVPRDRTGVSLAMMDDSERAATLALLRSILPPLGFQVVERVRGLEDVLREIEGAEYRDSLRYHVSVFGSPSPEEPFAIRYEGHHVSVGFTRVGTEVARTPFFLGANPAVVRSGPKRGEEVLGALTRDANLFFDSLTEEQRAEARYSPSVPDDVFGVPKSPPAACESGLDLEKLLLPQRAYLGFVLNHIAALGAMDPRHGVIAAVQDRGRVRFAGSTDEGEPIYWSLHLDGEPLLGFDSLVVEYVNVQNQANHVHLLVRSPDDDFGARLLAAHLAADADPGSTGDRRDGN